MFCLEKNTAMVKGKNSQANYKDAPALVDTIQSPITEKMPEAPCHFRN